MSVTAVTGVTGKNIPPYKSREYTHDEDNEIYVCFSRVEKFEINPLQPLQGLIMRNLTVTKPLHSRYEVLQNDI